MINSTISGDVKLSNYTVQEIHTVLGNKLTDNILTLKKNIGFYQNWLDKMEWIKPVVLNQQNK